MPAPRPAIVVVGSLNVDHTFRVPRLPQPGETLTALGAAEGFGGKGANQAVAAARAGAVVQLVGCAGCDDAGGRYLAHLAAEGIVTSGIARVEAPTGSAFICVDAAGENTIVVHPGANHALTPAHIDRVAPAIRAAGLLLLQFECPPPALIRAAQIARDARVPIIVNPSPWQEAFHTAPWPCDVLIVNETEAKALTGCEPDRLFATGADRSLCPTLIITRGPRPTLVISAAEGSFALEPPTVNPVDTVGAGDTFAGAFAAARAGGADWREAVAFANAAAALATLQPGAQTAMPTRERIRQFLPQLPPSAR